MADNSPTASPVYPRLPLKTRLLVTVMSAATDACRRSDGTINRRVITVLDFKSAPTPSSHRGVATSDLTINSNCWLRLFVPTAAAGGPPLPLVVFFHGGGFAYLSAASRPYDAVCRRIARALPAVVASVDYRLSPEHRCPAPYDDGLAALRFIDSGGLGDAPADLSSCFLAGDSAGGNISHHVAARWAAAGDWKKLKLKGVVAIQPWFGGEERTEAETRLAAAPLVSVERTDWLWKAFLPEGADRDHEAANVFGPRAAKLPEGFPAVAVVVGGYDPLQDWQRRYYQWLTKCGVEAKLVEFPDAIHAFYVFPELPDSGKLIDVVREFVGAHRSAPAAAEDGNSG